MRIHCDAKCHSASVRVRQHGAAQNDRTRCHHSGCSGFFETCASYRNWPAAGCRRKKQPAGAKDSPAGVKWRGQEPNKRVVAQESRGSTPSATQNTTHFRPIGSTCSPAKMRGPAGDVLRHRWHPSRIHGSDSGEILRGKLPHVGDLHGRSGAAVRRDQVHRNRPAEEGVRFPQAAEAHREAEVQ